MPARDLSVLFDDTYDYTLPSKKHPNGKLYRVPSPDALTGARLTYQAAIGLKIGRGEGITDAEKAAVSLDDAAEDDFYKDTLGPVYDEMLTDGVTWALLQATAKDAYLCITGNEGLADFSLASAKVDAAARSAADDDGSPAAEGEASARPNRATRRAVSPPKKAGSKSSPASTATRARTPARTSTRSSKSTGMKAAG